MTDSTRCACANCEWTGPIEEADEVRDFWSRVSPGDTVPAGDCPECGAFAFLCDEAAPASPESAPLAAIIAEWDSGRTGWRDDAEARLNGLSDVIEAARKATR